ncbi:MAG: hypothetical protein JWN96_1235 [Mycobacterium sp.]|nr:hypothetical protein [Mycobacterium sp.]
MALPLTTACQTRIGLAASVGKQQIETSKMTAFADRSATVLAANGNAVPASDEAKLQLGVLNLLVRAALIDQIATDEGVTVSPAEVATERAAEAKAAGGEKALITTSEQGGVSAADMDLTVREAALINKLQAKFGGDATSSGNKLTAAAQKIGVRINPRFGTWDAKTLAIGGAVNDLSSTVTKK